MQVFPSGFFLSNGSLNQNQNNKQLKKRNWLKTITKKLAFIWCYFNPRGFGIVAPLHSQQLNKQTSTKYNT